MKRWEVVAAGILMCISITGCQRQSVEDIIAAQEKVSQETVSEGNSKPKQELESVAPKVINYKTHEEEVVNKPNNVIKAKLLGRYDRVSDEKETYQINMEKVQLADDFTNLPEEQQEYFTTYGEEDGELTKYCNRDESLFVFITVKVKNTQDKELDFCARNLQLYNIYPDQTHKYTYYYGVTKDNVVVYGNSYNGTKHDGFVRIQAGEEKEFVVAFYNVPKHQVKLIDGFTGERQYYENCGLENTYMKTNHMSGSIVQDESLLYLGVENNRVEE